RSPNGANPPRKPIEVRSAKQILERPPACTWCFKTNRSHGRWLQAPGTRVTAAREREHRQAWCSGFDPRSCQKIGDRLDLVEAHKRGCVATALDIMHACPRVPPDHLVREVRRQHVGFHTAKCKDRHLDAGPVFPEINAVVPWISECPYDLRIEERDVTLSAG